MVEKNPLHRRMIDDVQLPNLSPVTQRCYVHALGRFARRSNQSPGGLELAEIYAYRIRLTTTGISWTRSTVACAALISRRFNPCCGMRLSPNVRCQTKGSAENRGGGPAEFRRSALVL